MLEKIYADLEMLLDLCPGAIGLWSPEMAERLYVASRCIKDAGVVASEAEDEIAVAAEYAAMTELVCRIKAMVVVKTPAIAPASETDGTDAPLLH